MHRICPAACAVCSPGTAKLDDTRISGQAPGKGIDSIQQIAGQIAGLHGNVGPHIGSETPAQIANSILAEMTAVKNGVAVRAGVPGANSRSVAML